jgi:hypothetical protein
MRTKRDLFADLAEASDALEFQRLGNRTLRAHALKIKPLARI